MHDILGDLPAPREITEARAQTLRTAVERAVREPGPRRSLSRPRILIPAALAASVAAIAITSAVLTPTSAYASWTAQPDTLNTAEITDLGGDCARSVRTQFPNAAPDLRPVLGERRGTFQTALIASGPQIAICADWLGINDGSTTRGGNLSGLTLDATLTPGQALQVVAVPGQLTGPDAARIAFGLVSADVAKVVVTTEDGKQVGASTSGGYFLAWWPSGAELARIEAFDSGGTTITTLANQ